LCTRTIISAFKVYSNLGEVIVCAYPVVSVWSLPDNEKQTKWTQVQEWSEFI
jgi:hypothetical protein